MKKFISITVLLSLGVTFVPASAMWQCPVSLKAAECNANRDFFTIKDVVRIRSNADAQEGAEQSAAPTPLDVISYFDFTAAQEKAILATALSDKPTAADNSRRECDLRPLEILLCKKAMQSQHWARKYRGSLGAVAGVAAGLVLAKALGKLSK